MSTSPLRIAAAFAAIASFALAPPAEAHRQWLLPSATVLSGKDAWITVDAAVSNDLFFFEHNPMRLDNLVVIGPDGAPVEPQNRSTGRYRSTFDVNLKLPGTYRVAVVNRGLLASYKENGQTRRWRGTPQAFAQQVPANAEALNVVESQARVEVFVTSGKPTTEVLQPTGRGLELAPITHPNDLFVGNEARFRLLLDGKPAAGLKVEVVRGGIRYRDKLGEIEVTTGEDGTFAYSWPEPGMYWIEAQVSDRNVAFPQATQRRASYIATFEVLPG